MATEIDKLRHMNRVLLAGLRSVMLDPRKATTETPLVIHAYNRIAVEPVEASDLDVVMGWPHGYALKPLNSSSDGTQSWFVVLFNGRGGEAWADPSHEEGQSKEEAIFTAAAWIRAQGVVNG